MKSYYYIQVIKNKTGFTQEASVDFNEILSFKEENYSTIINKFFSPINATVKLITGNFNTTVFVPTDDSIEVYFCLVDNENYPAEAKKVTLTEEQIDTIRGTLSNKVESSEGVYPENSINIISQFVTPRFKFNSEDEILYYNYKFFNNDTIVFGPPGSGKTTILRRITIEVLRDYLESELELQKLPIYIQLRNFNVLNIEFEHFLDNSISNYFQEFNILSNEEYIKSGKLLLLLDGADEIDFEKFKSFSNCISEYKNKHPYISFIISSRPDRSFSQLKDFSTCYLEPFTYSQIKESTYKKLSYDNWEEFIAILNSSPEVYNLLQNPLMLTFSHFLFQSKKILPLNTGQLLKELVNVLISSWDSNRKIERRFNKEVVNPNQIIHVLGKLSLIITEEEKSQIKTKVVYNKFPEFETYEMFIEFLQYIEFGTGIIKNEKDEVFFTHKSLQDFFCSNFLVEGIQEISKKIFVDKNWSKILKIISGLSSDSNYLIKEIISNSEMGDFEKVNSSILIFSETNNLSKNDLKTSFDLLEKYFIQFEQLNDVQDDNIKYDLKKILIKSIVDVKGFKEIMELLDSIFKIRFTKYEYDFNGYLKNSKSKILKSINDINTKKGNIICKTYDNEIIIHKENVTKQ
jgi:hypothetical protein